MYSTINPAHTIHHWSVTKVSDNDAKSAGYQNTKKPVYKDQAKVVSVEGSIYVEVLHCTVEPVYKDHPRDQEKVVSTQTGVINRSKTVDGSIAVTFTRSSLHSL